MTPSPGWNHHQNHHQHHQHDRLNDDFRNKRPDHSRGQNPSNYYDSSSRPNQFPQPHHLYSNFEGIGQSVGSGSSGGGVENNKNNKDIRASGLPILPRSRINNSNNEHEPQFRSNNFSNNRIIGGGIGGGGSEINNHFFPSHVQQQHHTSNTIGSRNASYSHHPINPYSPPRSSSSAAIGGGETHLYDSSFNPDQRFNNPFGDQQRKFIPRPYDERQYSTSSEDVMMHEENGRREKKRIPKSEEIIHSDLQNVSNNKSSDLIIGRTGNTKKDSPVMNTKNKLDSTEKINSPTNLSSTKETKESAGRKQNSACDACRNRKVRCHRTPGEEKCNHCKSKGIECTTIYVQLATQGIKRPIKRQRGEALPTEHDTIPTMGIDVPQVVRYLLLRDGEYAEVVQGLSYFDMPGKRLPPTTAAETRLINATARQEFVSSLLETYFNIVHIRYPVIDPQEFLQRFHYQTPELGGAPPDVLTAVLLAWGAKFSTHPIIVADRRETANEELTPSQRLRRSVNNPLANRALNSSHGSESSRTGTGGSNGGGGGKTELSTLTSGESRDISRVMGRSRIAEDLIIKAQEVLDRNKAHRIASMDNAKAAIIIQALFWQQASQKDLSEGTTSSQLRPYKRRGVYICNGAWIDSAISHMFEMRVHLKSTVDKIVDEGQRNQVAMSWFIACIFDSHMSAFYRRKPLVAAEDASIEPPMPARPGPSMGPSPIGAEEGYRSWLQSAIDQCEMMRMVYPTLWTPCAYEEGISARKLEKLVSAAYRWRSDHLALVGAPEPDWPSNWKFVDAVTACSSDLNYHVIWLLIWQAIDEYGIAELKSTNLARYNSVCERHGTPIASSRAEMELDQSKVSGMRNAIYDEALRAALRSADLARMLSDFDYLQNEAGIMKFALCEAGYCLTRFQRPEVYKIIEGLRQYGQAFEECYEQADELERLAMEYSAPPGSGQNSAVAAVNIPTKPHSRGGGGGNQRLTTSSSEKSVGGVFGFSASGPFPNHSPPDSTTLYSNSPRNPHQQLPPHQHYQMQSQMNELASGGGGGSSLSSNKGGSSDRKGNSPTSSRKYGHYPPT